MSKTIVLIHGAWLTTASWNNFRHLFEEQGYRVVVPAWPYLNHPVEQLRRQPEPRLADITIRNLVDHFEQQIRTLPEPPILMGHSFGGLIVQMLLDRGLGAAGVAICSAPPRGVLPSLTAAKAALPVLLTWCGWRRILTMPFTRFTNTFANTLAQGRQRQAYDEHIVPTPGRIYFQAALGIGNSVNFKNPHRPPLLLMMAEKDRISTCSMTRAMYRKHSLAPSRTDIMEFPNRSHCLIIEPGWNNVASCALVWARWVAIDSTKAKFKSDGETGGGKWREENSAASSRGGALDEGARRFHDTGLA